ncbi:MAG: hypothetical protein J2P48_10975 [Alphaproteobacteria bacterium]|nr:hypothetical protein [Alphaproteobacteria bacterium]
MGKAASAAPIGGDPFGGLGSVFDPMSSGIDPFGGVMGLGGGDGLFGGSPNTSSGGGGLFGSANVPGDLSSQGTGLPANLYDQASNLGGQNVTSQPQPNTPGSAQLASTPVETQPIIPPSQEPGPFSNYSSYFDAGTSSPVSSGAAPGTSGSAMSTIPSATGGDTLTAADRAAAPPTAVASNNPFTAGTSPIANTPYGAFGPSGNAANAPFAAPATAANFPSPDAGTAVAATPTPSPPAPAPVSTATAAPSPAETAAARTSADVTAQQPSADVTSPTGGVNHAQNIQQSLASMGFPGEVIQAIGSIFSALASHANPLQFLQQMLGMMRQGMTQGLAGGPPIQRGAPGVHRGETLRVGMVINGWRYNGGNPNDTNSWTYVGGGSTDSASAPTDGSSSTIPPPGANRSPIYQGYGPHGSI